jgi:hypothetical protein
LAITVFNAGVINMLGSGAGNAIQDAEKYYTPLKADLHLGMKYIIECI